MFIDDDENDIWISTLIKYQYIKINIGSMNKSPYDILTHNFSVRIL